MTKGTAAEQSYRTDLRKMKAEQLAALIMHSIQPHLEELRRDPEFKAYRYISSEIVRLFTQEGVDVLTDADRAKAGLPPRGPDGWTAPEMRVFEALRLETLMRPLGNFYVPSEDPGSAPKSKPST